MKIQSIQTLWPYIESILLNYCTNFPAMFNCSQNLNDDLTKTILTYQSSQRCWPKVSHKILPFPPLNWLKPKIRAFELASL